MNALTAIDRPRPLVLAGAQGPLVAVYHPPASPNAAHGDILVVPAFAEEMHRCRSMVTMQAQRLAQQGIGTLVLDPFGTGDSGGEFEQATWDGWRADLQLGVAWLRQHGQGCRTLLGVRLGALMAAELAQADAGIDRLALWMPVVSGKTYWTQFLRIRIAAEMGLADGIKSTELLRQRSARGDIVETSGYQVGPALAQRLDRLEVPPGGALSGKSVLWIETTVKVDTPPPRSGAKVIEAWRASGVDVQAMQVTGPQFWLAHDREVAPELLDATAAALLSGPVPAPWPRAAAPAAPVVMLERGVATEWPVVFHCGNDLLTGIVHAGAPNALTGVVIVVAGGPQYRAGAHRQFVSLARLLASHGYPVLRFDLRGMGDSSGQHLGYEQSRPDIDSAIGALMQQVPGLRDVALFGECNSASGILFYAAQDQRVRQIALANPWVRTPEVQAEAILKHYYLDRLKSREFWLHIRSGKFRLADSLKSFAELLLTFVRSRKQLRRGSAADQQAVFDKLPLPVRTAEGLRRFQGRVLFLLSGRDLIAREFDDVLKSVAAWRGLLDNPRVSRRDILDADHTFSKPAAKAEAQRAVLDWLQAGQQQGPQPHG